MSWDQGYPREKPGRPGTVEFKGHISAPKNWNYARSIDLYLRNRTSQEVYKIQVAVEFVGNPTTGGQEGDWEGTANLPPATYDAWVTWQAAEPNNTIHLYSPGMQSCVIGGNHPAHTSPGTATIGAPNRKVNPNTVAGTYSVTSGWTLTGGANDHSFQMIPTQPGEVFLAPITIGGATGNGNWSTTFGHPGPNYKLIPVFQATLNKQLGYFAAPPQETN